MKVSELGEFGMIDRVAAKLAAHSPDVQTGQLFLGIGDDAAVWLQQEGALLATTDTMVEGIHFVPGKTRWSDVGWKALAVNVSDIAAMGGRPEFALVTIALPGDARVEDIDELYDGLADAAEAMGLVIAGGDIVRAREFMISVSVTGSAGLDDSRHPAVMQRSGAREGDVIAVSGTLGSAAGGLRILESDRPQTGDRGERLLERHFRPQARVDVGLAAIGANIRCGMDVSDGLLQDLAHICAASRLGAAVWADKLPIAPELREAFGDEDAVLLAATGGEDYELLLTGTQEQIHVVAGQCDVPITVIGEMVIQAEHTPVLLGPSGKPIEVAAGGWDHLRAP